MPWLNQAGDCRSNASRFADDRPAAAFDPAIARTNALPTLRMAGKRHLGARREDADLGGVARLFCGGEVLKLVSASVDTRPQSRCICSADRSRGIGKDGKRNARSNLHGHVEPLIDGEAFSCIALKSYCIDSDDTATFTAPVALAITRKVLSS